MANDINSEHQAMGSALINGDIRQYEDIRFQLWDCFLVT
jgi:hypothetical protein